MHNYAFDKRSVKKTEECAQLVETSGQIQAKDRPKSPQCRQQGEFCRMRVTKEYWQAVAIETITEKYGKPKNELEMFVRRLADANSSPLDWRTLLTWRSRVSATVDNYGTGEQDQKKAGLYELLGVGSSQFRKIVKELEELGLIVWMSNNKYETGGEARCFLMAKLPRESRDSVLRFFFKASYTEHKEWTIQRFKPYISVLQRFNRTFESMDVGRPFCPEIDEESPYFFTCAKRQMFINRVGLPISEQGCAEKSAGVCRKSGFSLIYISSSSITISDTSLNPDPASNPLPEQSEEGKDQDEKTEVVDVDPKVVQLKSWWVGQLQNKQVGSAVLRKPSKRSSWMFDVGKAEATVTTLIERGWSTQQVYDFLNEQLHRFAQLRQGSKVTTMRYINEFSLKHILEDKVKPQAIEPPTVEQPKLESTPQPEPPKPQKASRLPERDNTDQAQRTYEHLLGADIDDLTERYHRGDFELIEAMSSLGKKLEDLVNDWRQKRNEATDKQLAQVVEISGVEVEKQAQKQQPSNCEQKELSDEQRIDGPIELHESVAEKLADALPMRTEKQTRDGLAAIGKFLGREPQEDIVIDVSNEPTVITLPIEQTPQRALSEWEQVIVYLREKMTQGAHMLDCITHRKYDELRYVLQAPALSDADKDYMKMQLSHGFKNAVKRHGVQMYFES